MAYQLKIKTDRLGDKQAKRVKYLIISAIGRLNADLRELVSDHRVHLQAASIEVAVEPKKKAAMLRRKTLRCPHCQAECVISASRGQFEALPYYTETDFISHLVAAHKLKRFAACALWHRLSEVN